MKGLLLMFLLFPLLSLGQLAKDKTPVHFKDSLKTKHLWLASQVLPGFGQVYNRQYLKAPIIWAGMGGAIYKGILANKTYSRYKSKYIEDSEESLADREYWHQQYTRIKQTRDLYFAVAGAFYITSIADALLVYNKNNHSPATATILSVILPGAGQIYNKKYWKVPLVYGGLSTLWFVVDWNNRYYIRFSRAFKSPNDNEFGTRYRADELKLYRDYYHRNRDVAFVWFIGLYIMNIIDANVDANLSDWNISNDLAFHVEPIIINNNFASRVYTQPAIGLSCKFNF